MNGKRVIILDVDLGAANLHTLLGIKYPPATFADFLYGEKKDINDILINTFHPNLRIISGAKDILNLANLPYFVKLKLINNIKKLNADYIFLDLGSGSSYNVIDFFRFTREGIMIISPEPTSIENVSTFIKKSIYRELTMNQEIKKNIPLQKIVAKLTDANDREITSISELLLVIQNKLPENLEKVRRILQSFNVHIILNRLRSSQDVNYAQAVIKYTEKYLNIKVDYAGFVREDSRISQSIKSFKPFINLYPKSESVFDLKKIMYNLKL